MLQRSSMSLTILIKWVNELILKYTLLLHWWGYKHVDTTRIFHSYQDVHIASSGLQTVAFPFLSTLCLSATRDLYRATPAVTRGLSICGLNRRTPPPNLDAFYDKHVVLRNYYNPNHHGIIFCLAAYTIMQVFYIHSH